MQPVRPALPEFDRMGNHAVTAPRFRPWRIGAMAFLDFGVGALEDRSIGDDTTLPRAQRGQPASRRTCREISVGLAGRSALDHAFDTDLPLELDPVEEERRIPV